MAAQGRQRQWRRAGAHVLRAGLAAGLLAGCGGGSAPPRAACTSSTWVAAWTADPSDASNPGMVAQTSRTVLTPHLGGDTLRVRLSNRLGAAPVTFGAASVGLRLGAGADLVAGSRRPLSFAGAATVTLAAGAEVESDPVALRLPPGADLGVSLFVARASGPATEHATGQQTSYFTPPGTGDHTGEETGRAFTLPTRARYFVSAVEVRAPASVGVVVAFGDSITDGFGGPPDHNDRYPDLLAQRLASETPGSRLSVVNAGIGGNRLLTDATAQMGGPSALDRLDRDAIGEPGVSDVILLEGINDIGNRATGGQVIAGLRTLVARLHAAGLRVQLGTLTPFGGTSAPPEAARQQVNAWIRGGGAGADGVVDFEAAVRDSARPARLDPRFDSGDHLHPNAAGRQAMAGKVDLAGLTGARCRAGG